MTSVSFLDRARYWLFGGTRTFMGAYREASDSAMKRAKEHKAGRNK
jgi:hypothetical protein